MLPKLSSILSVDVEELNALWVADQVCKLLEGEQKTQDVLSIVCDDFSQKN